MVPIKNGCRSVHRGWLVIRHKWTWWGKKRLYGEKFHAMIPVATGKLIGKIRKYVEYWTPDELNRGVQSDTFGVRQRHLINMERESTIGINSEERGMYYVSVWNESLQKYITYAMGIVHDWFIPKIDNEFKEITLLRSYVLTDVFQRFCDRQECGATGTD